MEKKIHKIDQVKSHLLKHGSITSLQAIALYNYTRLSDCIWKLRRKENWQIESEDKHILDCNGNNCNYALYKLISTPENDAITALRNDLSNKDTGHKTDAERRKANKKEKKEDTTQQYQYLFS